MELIFILKNILIETCTIFNDASIYVMLGLIVAGIIHIFIPADKLIKYIKGDDIKSVLYASILGVPIPLCSCGVLPTAISLRKNGAGRGATVAFLISTPESGVDSIAVTYALIDPIMTIARPVSAFITASMAGILTNFIHRGEEDRDLDLHDEHNCKIAGCDLEFCEGSHAHTFKERVTGALHYSFLELAADMAKWFFIGMLFAGLISYLIPDNFFEVYLGSGLTSMIVMLVVGIPLYICASSSTPIAAAMIAKGLSPGAALVFLLSGPATNVVSLSIIPKFIGKKGTIAYLVSIAVSSLVLGVILNMIYSGFSITPQVSIGKADELFPQWMKIPASILLATILGNGLIYNYRNQK